MEGEASLVLERGLRPDDAVGDRLLDAHERDSTQDVVGPDEIEQREPREGQERDPLNHANYGIRPRPVSFPGICGIDVNELLSRRSAGPAVSAPV